MESHCVRPEDIPQAGKLHVSYLENFQSVKDFYAHPPDEEGVRAAAAEVHLDEAHRKKIVEILREQNRAFLNGGGALSQAVRAEESKLEANLERLVHGAVAIVTGQQAGLFGGPAYTFYKALDAIAWAERLSRNGLDAVPIFWAATEDHDLAEVNQAHFGGREGMARLELPVAEEFSGASVGRIPLGEMAAAAVEHAAQLLEGPGAEAIKTALAESYRPGETFGSAFARLMAQLFASRGLILMDPLDRRWHELARPIYHKAAEQSEAIGTELVARTKELDARGFVAQVKVTAQQTLLFTDIDSKRQPLRRKGAAFAAGGEEWSATTLAEKIEREPERFSASVLLRPVLQDFLLPTAAYVGGPAEVAYMAQAQVVYRRVLGRMPAILPRASFTLIEPEVARTLEKYHCDFSDVLQGRQHLRRKMALQYVPRGLAAKFARDERTLRRILGSYREPLEKLDKTLADALGTAEEKMLYQFERLRTRAAGAENMRTGVLDRHEGQILSALLPHHGLQERTLSLLPFIARRGMELLDTLTAEMAKPCPGHRVASL